MKEREIIFALDTLGNVRLMAKLFALFNNAKIKRANDFFINLCYGVRYCNHNRARQRNFASLKGERGLEIRQPLAYSAETCRFPDRFLSLSRVDLQ